MHACLPLELPAEVITSDCEVDNYTGAFGFTNDVLSSKHLKRALTSFHRSWILCVLLGRHRRAVLKFPSEFISAHPPRTTLKGSSDSGRRQTVVTAQHAREKPWMFPSSFFAYLARLTVLLPKSILLAVAIIKNLNWLDWSFPLLFRFCLQNQFGFRAEDALYGQLVN